MLRLSDFRNDLVDKCDQCLVYFMAFVDCLDHLIFRDLICSRLDHNDLLGSRCNGQFQIAFIPLFLGRIYDKFSIDHTHLCHCARTIKRDIGNRRRDRSAKHGNDLRTAFRIYGHDHII